MNDKFFQLPKEKQQKIVNAAYQVFAKNEYKRAPMSEIADEAGISKALLFHYFTNKQELYLYLWDSAQNLTCHMAQEYRVLEADNFFEMLRRNLKGKCEVVRMYPNLYAFVLNAYYERTPEIQKSIQDKLLRANKDGEQVLLKYFQSAFFRKDIDLKSMYRVITLACDGYLNQAYRSGNISPDIMKKELNSLIDHWEKIYRGGNYDSL